MKELLGLAMRHGLTLNQVMFLFIVKYNDDIDRTKAINLLAEYQKSSPIGKLLTTTERDNLFERDYLMLLRESETIGFDDIALGRKAMTLFADPYVLGNEFWKVYPAFAKINGVDIPIRLCNKAKLRELYAKTISFSIPRHQFILGVTRDGAAAGLINYNVVKYVESEYWDALYEKLNNSNLFNQASNEIL
jgi:hypothetical protein